MEDMNNKQGRRPRLPLWFGITAAASFIPVLAWPWLIATSDVLDDPGNMVNLLLIRLLHIRTGGNQTLVTDEQGPASRYNRH